MPQVRIYIQVLIKKNEYIFLDKNNLHYLKNVMRKKNGDKVIVFNDNEEWQSTFLEDKEFKLKPDKLLRKKTNAEDIWICFGLIKPRNIDFLVEKVSEIGVKKIIPMITKYSNQIPLNFKRLKKISIEADEQSTSLNLPEIFETKKFIEVISDWEDDRLIIFCDEKKGLNINKVEREKNNFDKIAIFVGPVGGWADEERNLISKNNNLRVNFGYNIMKADTSAIYCLSIFKGYLL